ncbi:single-stranded DNA-binding protein [Gallibacterium trehalosifermentans]|uniref:Single-stranded DNA-binding protein n=1 Tax=Gallibacterium trehalosifermentans TaxID=516935 RepID=A0ABV6GZ37_9PAST
MSINKCIFIGNLTNTPEIRQFPNGDSVASFSIALNEKFKNKQSEITEHVEFIRIVLFRRLAEIAGQYLRKGSKVYIEGKIRTRKWQDQNGQERYLTEIHADTLQMLDSRNESSSNLQANSQANLQAQSNKPNAYAQAKASGISKTPPQTEFDDESDLPF